MIFTQTVVQVVIGIIQAYHSGYDLSLHLYSGVTLFCTMYDG